MAFMSGVLLSTANKVAGSDSRTPLTQATARQWDESGTIELPVLECVSSEGCHRYIVPTEPGCWDPSWVKRQTCINQINQHEIRLALRDRQKQSHQEV